MRTTHRRVHGILPLVGLIAAGCVHHYAEPRADEPHALMRVRAVHHHWAGPSLSERVQLNGYDIEMPPAVRTAPRTRAIRVRPEPGAWSFETQFFHYRSRQELRPYTRQEPCGTTTTGFGRSRRTETRYCTRTEQRWETVRDRIVDAACAAQVVHTPIAGGVYLVQYDFYAHGQCTAQCLRQLTQPDGTFRLIPCGAGEPPTAPLTSGGEAYALPPPPGAVPQPTQPLPAQPPPVQPQPAQTQPAQPAQPPRTQPAQPPQQPAHEPRDDERAPAQPSSRPTPRPSQELGTP